MYCGSRKGNDPVYVQSAHELGRALVEAGLGLVYGGAVIGCLGAVADGVIEKTALPWVIPEFKDGSSLWRMAG